MEEVLKLMVFPIVAMIDNLFHFILFFVTNQLWWWTLKLGSMFMSFFVRG